MHFGSIIPEAQSSGTIQALNTREVIYSLGGLHSSSISRYFLVAGTGEYEGSVVKDVAASSGRSLQVLTLPERRVRKMYGMSRKVASGLRGITVTNLSSIRSKNA
jgi:hypothetical protein